MKQLLQETLSDFKNEIKTFFKNEIEKINTEVKDLTKSVEFLSSQYDDIFAENKKLKVEMNDVNKIAAIQNKKILELEEIVKSNKKQIHAMENLSRSNNLEVHGITYKPNEKTDRIIFNTLKIVEPEIKETDIISSFRLKKKRTNRNETTDGPIIVKLANNEIRSRCYYNKKKLAGFAFRDIGIEAEKIFLNENLCQASRQLFYKANMQKKKFKWKFIWTNNGSIKMKKDHDSQIITIDDEESLKKVCSDTPGTSDDL